MKHTFLKITNLIALAAVAFALPSCLKENDATFTDFSQAGNNVALMTPSNSAPGQYAFVGLGAFKASNVDPYSKDSTIIDLVVQFNGEFAPTSDVAVTLAVDDAKRVAYNGTQTINFLAMLPTMYKLGQTSLVIKAGTRNIRTQVTIYSDPIKAQDPDKSWMLPISLTNASGNSITSNSTMYINVIGNPIAGPMLWDFKRWNLTAQQTAEPTSAPNGGSWVNQPTAFVPLNGTAILVPSGYFVQPNYQLSFTNTAGVLTNFQAVIYQPDLDALIAAGITVTDGPNVLIAIPSGSGAKRYKLQYQVFNGTAYRYIIDEFHNP
jgi:Domain of unknown function (DUF1735)